LSDLAVEVLSYLPHSSGLVLSKYHVFKDLNNHLGVEKFKDKRTIENAFDEFLGALDP
jgi:hypothetical protein